MKLSAVVLEKSDEVHHEFQCVPREIVGRTGRIVAMSQVSEHYRMLLGLDDTQRVDPVDLRLEGQVIVICLEHKGQRLVGTECGGACSQAALASERTWRHPNTMQFTTEMRARVLRSISSKCRLKTLALPWAGKHSRFTLMIEAFAIEVLQACSNVKPVAALLLFHWDSVQAIIERAVESGQKPRGIFNLPS